MAQGSEEDASVESNCSDGGAPELPSLEDRRVFLTCLACILTSSYEYDVTDEAEAERAAMIDAALAATTKNSATTTTTTTLNGSPFGTPERPGNDPTTGRMVVGTTCSSDGEEDGDDDDDDDDDAVEEDPTTILLMAGGTTDQEVSMFLEEEEEEAAAIGRANITGSTITSTSTSTSTSSAIEAGQQAEQGTTESKDTAHSNTNDSTNSGAPTRRRWRPRFGRNNNNNTTNTKTESSQSETEPHKSVNFSTSHGDPDHPGAASTEMTNSTTTTTTNATTNATTTNSKEQGQQRRKQRLSRAQKKLRLASTRHYRRRFLVADQLLQASCDQLLLQKELSDPVYRALKPQLESLKAPRMVPSTGQEIDNNNAPTTTNNNNRRSIRNRWPKNTATLGGSSVESNEDDDTDNSSTSSSSDGEGSPKGTEPNNENANKQSQIGDENASNNDNNDHNNNNNNNNDEDQSETDKEAKERQMKQQYLKQHEWMTEYDEQLAEHLPKLTAGAGYRCLCWLLFQHLINASKRGYDARVRFAFKSLAVAVLVQDIERTLSYTDNGEGNDYNEWKAKNYTTWVSFATRKFEQMEASTADRLLKLAQQPGSGAETPYDSEGEAAQSPAVSLEELDNSQDEIQVVSVKKNKKKLAGAKKHLVRGLKIGGVGVVAGTLLAVTGGMAAPAIAGALTFLGMGAVAGTFLTLASTSAVVHLFGVAGGSLAAYKMRRRTAGLTEFTIVQSLTTASRQTEDTSEHSNSDLLPGEQPQVKHQPRLARWREKAKAFKNRHTNQKSNDDPNGLPTNVELSRTICVSGWLTDKCDFQRPWGITPTTPPPSKLEKLQRFYRIYNPDLIPVCDNLLKRWKKEMSTFWDLLEDKYGCNPDTLFPLRFGPMHDAALTEVEILLLDKLILEIGEARGKRKEAENADLPAHVHSAIASKSNGIDTTAEHGAIRTVNSDNTGMDEPEGDEENQDENDSNRFQRQCYASVFEQVAPSASLDKLIPPDHLATVWDFSSRYGGELYTLHWESQVLLKLCLCFRDVALSATASAGQQAIRLMVANTLYLAASVPIYLVQAMNSIDETWSLVVSRAEEAGKELARSLLVNEAGHRPVTLVAYSFGARVVFSCLKQLAVYQQQWEEYHEQKHTRAIGFAQHDEEGKSPNRKEKKWMLHELEFEREPASVVEDVILMGAPMYLSLSSWKACRQVVAGRFVNVYSRTDRILSLMFKYKQMMESFKPVCGNCTVAVPGVENIDISDLVSNHQEYVLKVGDILKRVRHGQPIRSSTNALDEIALIAEAGALAKQQEAEAATAAAAETESNAES